MLHLLCDRSFDVVASYFHQAIFDSIYQIYAECPSKSGEGSNVG